MKEEKGYKQNTETENTLKIVVHHVFGELDALEMYTDFLADRLKDCVPAPAYGNSAS